jgi:hypothetical protein
MMVLKSQYIHTQTFTCMHNGVMDKDKCVDCMASDSFLVDLCINPALATRTVAKAGLY